MAKTWTPITDAIKARIIDANARGMEPRAIAQMIPVSRDTVRKVLYEHSAKCRLAEKHVAESERKIKQAAELLIAVQKEIFPLAVK